MDTREKKFYVGIDLGEEYSQVSYYNCIDAEPVSVDFGTDSTECRVPTVVGKTIGRDEWFAGDEAIHGASLGEVIAVDGLLKKAADKNPVTVDKVSVMPVRLIAGYLDYLIQAAKLAGESDTADRVCITLENYNISVLNVLLKALNSIGYPDDAIEFAGRDESFIYYAISQKNELWKNDVFLFDYSNKGLIVKRMYTVNERGSRIIMVHTDDMSDEVTDAMRRNKASEEYLDSRLKETAVKLFEHHNISTVYLTGEAFAGEFNTPSFIGYICDRRRVFAGDNLYCKGACYQAVAADYPPDRDIIVACKERITTGIEIRISDRGRDKIFRLVRPGINWFGADCSYDFILDGAEEAELFLSPIDTREKQLIRISFAELPVRPDKATRITISFSFTSDSRCHMMVKDKGFGEFYKSSGRVINEELLL